MHSADKILESSNLKSKADNSAMVKSKREKFFDSYFRQNFALPSDSIIYYIAKNPPSPELYQKMVQTCKYFFVENPILVIPDLDYYGDDKWQYSFEKCRFDFSQIMSKLWIIDRLFVHPKYSGNKKVVNQNILSSLMPKISQCDAKFVSINHQVISCHDLSLLTSSAEDIRLHYVNVKDKNGLNVTVEKIVEVAVKAKKIVFESNTTLSNLTSETMKELLKIPHFLKLDVFIMDRIPETFDLETFYGYMKNNTTTKISLSFDDSVSEVYKNRLEEIVDEILATETHGYKPPYLGFEELDEVKFLELSEIICSH